MLEPRSERICVAFTAREMAAIDVARAGEKRSTWIREKLMLTPGVDRQSFIRDARARKRSKRHGRTKADSVKAYNLYAVHDVPVKRIASDLRVTVATIYNYIRVEADKLGVCAIQHDHRGDRPLKASPAEAYHLYVTLHMAAKAVAPIMGIVPATVLNYVRSERDRRGE